MESHQSLRKEAEMPGQMFPIQVPFVVSTEGKQYQQQEQQ